MAKRTDAELWIGTDHQFIFSIMSADETQAIDITGWTLSWIVKRKVSDTDLAALLTKTVGSGIAISGTFDVVPTTNTQVATVTVTDANTDALSPGVAWYELKRTTADAETILAYGLLRLLQGVHRT